MSKGKEIQNAAITGIGVEITQRYGSAVKKHLVSYSGTDNETGKVLSKSLKSISEQKEHPDYKKQNQQQKAGFAAEVKEVANRNAEAEIQKSKTRLVRTDDIGKVNDPLLDHVEVDLDGNIILGSGSQMKFIANDPEAALKKMMSGKCSKYLENDIELIVPSDYYQGILDGADREIEKQKRMEAYQKLKKNLRKSTVSTKEAKFASQHPKLSTAKSIANVAHRAGVEQAKNSAMVGGGFSAVINTIDVVKGEKKVKEAVVDVAKDAAESGVRGYSMGVTSSVLKGVMQNSKVKMLQTMSKSNLPTFFVSCVMDAGKPIKEYCLKERTGRECLEEIGEKSVEKICGSLGAAIGQVLVPLPGVGAIVGSMLGTKFFYARYMEIEEI